MAGRPGPPRARPGHSYKKVNPVSRMPGATRGKGASTEREERAAAWPVSLPSVPGIANGVVGKPSVCNGRAGKRRQDRQEKSERYSHFVWMEKQAVISGCEEEIANTTADGILHVRRRGPQFPATLSTLSGF